MYFGTLGFSKQDLDIWSKIKICSSIKILRYFAPSNIHTETFYAAPVLFMVFERFAI